MRYRNISLSLPAATPWVETLPAVEPLSLYAAIKRAAELLAFTHHHLYGTPTRVVRFFTVAALDCEYAFETFSLGNSPPGRACQFREAA